MNIFDMPKHHWNYFLAIEQDLKGVSRYVEFTKDNFSTYSIELVHILLSASAEIDVLLKMLCELLDPETKTNNINQYREVIQNKMEGLIEEEFTIPIYSIVNNPWILWKDGENPKWWKSYNNVKHERNNHFNKGNLQNAIDAVGALLIVNIYYYRELFKKHTNNQIDFVKTISELYPSASFMKINKNYYLKSLGALF